MRAPHWYLWVLVGRGAGSHGQWARGAGAPKPDFSHGGRCGRRVCLRWAALNKAVALVTCTLSSVFLFISGSVNFICC